MRFDWFGVQFRPSPKFNGLVRFGSDGSARSLYFFFVGSSGSQAATAPNRAALYRLVKATLDPADVARGAYTLGICVAAHVLFCLPSVRIYRLILSSLADVMEIFPSAGENELLIGCRPCLFGRSYNKVVY